MDISKLEVGMKVKNYKELCELLGEKVKGGKSKVLQLQDLERYIRYEREGNAFIIKEIFKRPRVKVDKRKDVHRVNSNSKYSEWIQVSIISILSQAKDNKMLLPASQLFLALDMVNGNMNLARSDIRRFSELTEIPEEYAHDFFSVNNTKLKQTLERALKTLRNRALVIWEKCLTVCIMVSDEEYNDFGDIIINPKDDKYGSIPYHTEHREATQEERELILATEEKVLDEMKSTSLQHVFLTGRWEHFQNRVKTILTREANILYYYDSYRLTFNKDTIYKSYLKRLKPDEREYVSKMLNDNICRMIENNAKTLHRRAKKKEDLFMFEKIHARDEYPKYTKQISDIVIRKDAESIERDMLNSEKKIKLKNLTPANSK